MGQGGKCDIPVLCSNDQTFIISTDKAECFADIFAEKSTISEAENEKQSPSRAQEDKCIHEEDCILAKESKKHSTEG